MRRKPETIKGLPRKEWFRLLAVRRHSKAHHKLSAFSERLLTEGFGDRLKVAIESPPSPPLAEYFFSVDYGNEPGKTPLHFEGRMVVPDTQEGKELFQEKLETFLQSDDKLGTALRKAGFRVGKERAKPGAKVGDADLISRRTDPRLMKFRSLWRE